jgi:hypothetical protein
LDKVSNCCRWLQVVASGCKFLRVVADGCMWLWKQLQLYASDCELLQVFSKLLQNVLSDCKF